MIEQIWRNLLTCDGFENLLSRDAVDEVIALLVEARIDPEKFTGNLLALVTGRMPSIVEMFDGMATLPTTGSISRFTSPVNSPLTEPFWVLAAFPDVFDWFNEKQRGLPGKSDDSFKGGDSNLHVRYFRDIVSNYLKETGRALEVTVDAGSDGDIYLGMELLKTAGEESNFTLIANKTTMYYIELKTSYASSLPDETSLLAMSGILDANIYILMQQITPSQIVDLARTTKDKSDRLLKFLVPFEAILLSIDTPEITPGEVRSICERQVEAISRSIQKTMGSYRGDPQISRHVRTVMSSPQFANWRSAAGVRPTSLLSKLKKIIFGK